MCTVEQQNRFEKEALKNNRYKKGNEPDGIVKRMIRSIVDDGMLRTIETPRVSDYGRIGKLKDKKLW